MGAARSSHTATLLPGGDVLVTGGFDGTDPDLDSVERFDVSKGRWSAQAPMRGARRDHTASELPGGRVLVAGGYFLGFLLSTSEIYDVHTGAWTQADDMNHERGGHVAVGMPHHQVLVVGGALGPTAEIFTAAPRR